MQEKNRNILIGSILMISGAGLSVVLTLVYGSVFGRSLEAYVGTLTADEAFAAELAASGMTLDAVVEAMQGTLTVLLVLAVLFQLVKIAVGVWGLRRAARPATAFVAWGAVFLALGLLGMMFSGVTSVFGLCDLAGGVLGRGAEQAGLPADAGGRAGRRGAAGGRIRLAAGAQVNTAYQKGERARCGFAPFFVYVQPARKTSRPPRQTAVTGTACSASAGRAKGSWPRTVKSARKPGAMRPLYPSSKLARAPATV